MQTGSPRTTEERTADYLVGAEPRIKWRTCQLFYIQCMLGIRGADASQARALIKC